MLQQIPNLFSTEWGLVKINPDFVDFNEIVNWSPERQIEVFWRLVRDYIYPKDSKIPEHKVDKLMQAFNWAYWISKFKFQDIERNTWGRYFDHLIRVMKYTVASSETPTLEKTIIALLHDLIEDTNKTFSWLREDFWNYIAFGVLLISKKPIKDFLSTRDYIPLDLLQEEKLRQSSIVNDKWDFLTQEYLERKYNNPKSITQEEKEAEALFIRSKNDFELFQIVDDKWVLNEKWLVSDEIRQLQTYTPEKITFEQRFALELYEKLEKKYKDIRNAEYFSHMLSEDDNIEYEEKIDEETPCLNKFYNHALSLVSSPNLKIRLSKEDIKKVCLDALEVKFWDRIDNLRTTEIYQNFSYENYKKAQRKIEETQKYFYKIALEFDKLMGTNFAFAIAFEVEKLKFYIYSKSRVDIKDKVDWILEK